VLILAIVELSMLCDSLDVVAAMSVDALICTDAVFTPDLYGPFRPHPKVIGLSLMGSG